MNENILIVDVLFNTKKGVVNKDVNSGLGTRTLIGKSFRAKILEKMKRKGVDMPLIEIAYISSLLKQHGNNTYYIKIQSEGEFEKLEKEIISQNISTLLFFPALVAYKDDLLIAKLIKSKFENIIIGVMGAMATHKPVELIDSKVVDWVIKGDSENYFLKSDISDINSQSGIVVVDDKVKNLDDLPFPDWAVFGKKLDFSYKPMLSRTPFLPILGSKGCPMSCKYYCPYPATQGAKYRRRSVESLISEIKYLKDKFSVKSILFRDPYFSLDNRRTIALAKALIDEDINILWGCETRLDSLSEENLTLLYKAGLRSINIGLETNDKFVLESNKRNGVDLTRDEKLIDFSYNLGIKINAFFIIGFNEDTRKTVLNMIQYAKSLNLYAAQFTVNTPLPGTEYYKDMSSQIIDNNLENFDNNTLVFKHKNLSKEDIEQLKEKAFVDYYFRFGFIRKYIRWTIRDLFF